MRKIKLLIVLLLAYSGMKAQSSCASPLNAVLDSIYQLENEESVWINFTPLSDSLLLAYGTLNSTDSVTMNIELRTICSGQAVFSTTLYSEMNSLLFQNLNTNQNYLLKLSFVSGNGSWIFRLGNEPEHVESSCINLPLSCELVCNGNFETLESNVPITSNIIPPELNRMNRWGRPLGMFNGTADSFWYDGTNGNIPFNANYTAAFGRNGSFGIAGLILHNAASNGAFYREYAQSKLIHTIKPGKRYIASFWVRHFENSRRQIDHVGMLFTPNPVPQTGGNVIQLQPQVSRSGTVFGNNWTNVVEMIENRTNDEWEYLTIGNFTTDTSNMVYLGASPAMSLTSAYYFFDDVSVIEIPSAGKDTTVCSGTQLEIGSLGCSLPTGASVYWADLQGNFISSSFPLTQVFNQSQTFVLHVNYQGLVYTDTIKVSVVCCSNIVYDYQFVNSTSASVEFPTILNLSNAIIVINKTFTLNKTMTFTDCHFYMGPDAEILVTAGVTFNLSNCILESCDEVNMWNGINLSQNSSLIDQNCTYKEAKTAIKSNFGAPITSYKSQFINNHTGIHLYFFQNLHPLSVDECVFEVNAQLLEPYAAQSNVATGILLEQINNVVIGRQYLTYEYEFNRFINLEYGIKAIRSGATIETNLFEDNAYGIYGDGYGYRSAQTYSIKIGHHNGAFANKFVNNTTGIYLTRGISSFIEYNNFIVNKTAISIYNQPSGRTFDVSHNTFAQNRKGVVFAELVNPHVEVYQNTFNFQELLFWTKNRIAISAFNAVQPSNSWIPNLPGATSLFKVTSNIISDYTKGIELTNISSAYIAENVISNVPSTWNATSYGISLHNCPMSQIKQNLVYGTNPSYWAAHGIASDFARDNLIEGNCVKDLGRGLWVGGYSGGVKINNNVMKNCNTGFFANWAFIGAIQKVINTGGQILIFPSDNKWDGSFNNHLYNHFQVGANSFSLRSPSSINYDPRYNPSNLNNGGSPSINIQNTLVSAANAPLDAYVFPACESGSVVFMVDTSEFHGLSPDEIAQIADTSSLQAYTPDEIAVEWLLTQSHYRELVQDTLNYYNNSILASFIGATNLSNIGEIENIDQLVNMGIESGSLVDLAAANAINNSMSLLELPAQTTHDFYEIYIQQLQNEEMAYALDSNQYQILSNIAELCPYIYGSSVYQARALLSIVDTAYEMNPTPCEMGYLNGAAKTDLPVDAQNYLDVKKVESGIVVYPNPSAGYVLVDLVNFKNTNAAEFVLFDVSGRALKSGKLNTEFSTLINLDGLAKGVYFIKVFTIDGVIGNEKIILSN